MDPLVLVEGRALAEAAATVSAAVGLLPSVDPEVGSEGRALGEGPTTVQAAVGPLTTVDGPVLAQRGGLTEALATVRATKGPLAGVCVQVLHQGGAPRKTLPAHVAAMTLVGPWNRGMGTEWGAAPARDLGGLLQTVRKPGRKGFGSLQPTRRCVHRKDLPRSLSPSSLSFLFFVFGICVCFCQTLSHLRISGIWTPQFGLFLHPGDEGGLGASESWGRRTPTPSRSHPHPRGFDDPDLGPPFLMQGPEAGQGGRGCALRRAVGLSPSAPR